MWDGRTGGDEGTRVEVCGSERDRGGGGGRAGVGGVPQMPPLAPTPVPHSVPHPHCSVRAVHSPLPLPTLTLDERLQGEDGGRGDAAHGEVVLFCVQGGAGACAQRTRVLFVGVDEGKEGVRVCMCVEARGGRCAGVGGALGEGQKNTRPSK